MRKVISGFLVLIFTFVSLSSSSFAYVGENASKNQMDRVYNSSYVASIEQKNLINTVEPYVEVTEDGKIQFKDVPQNIYEQYNLYELQKHFDILNATVENEYITINKDLSIINNTISPFASYSEWTYHWWGYDRYFDDSQAKAYANDLSAAAAGATLAIGIGGVFPPIAGIGTIAAGYWGLLSSRVNKNNKGNGVYVAVTWVLIFDVEPL